MPLPRSRLLGITLGHVVKNVAKALGDINIRDLDKALVAIPKSREVVERNNRIRELQKDKAIFKVQLTWKESKLTNADWKTGEAVHLFTQFDNFVGQPGDLLTKAWVFDETMAKLLPLTGAKVLHIVVDYTAKMETLLA